MAKTRKLSPSAIDELKQGELRDERTPGLFIEVLSSGKKVWKYARRVANGGPLVRLSLGPFPACTIAAAREWAGKLNESSQAGIDPRQVIEEEERRASMTVDRAHSLYMQAVREGRSSRAKRPNKLRTVLDKLEIYNRDISPSIGKLIIYDVTETDLVQLVLKKGEVARIRANRLAAELKVFFGWAASLRGMQVGLETDPSRRLGDLRFPETSRDRKLGPQELEWLLRALVPEERDYQRGFLLCLLSAARLGEVVDARTSEYCAGVWTIPSSRTKNMVEHQIALGPWGQSLIKSEGDWVFPAPKREGPRSRNCWYVARNRIKRRMEAIAGRPIERFTPHDFRRTSRSNTKRLKIDFETAEAMLNHVKKGLERTYDCYELEDEKRASFLKWEREIVEIARRAGLSAALQLPEVPADDASDGQ